MVKQLKGCEGKREDKFDIVKDLMKHKKKDSIKCLKLSKHTLNKSNVSLSKTVRKGTVVMEAFMEVVDMKLNFALKNGKDKTIDKKDWAIHKYISADEQIEVLKGVLVGDKVLEEYETKNKAIENGKKASIYCDIKVTKQQEEILLLPPEHQTFPKLDIE